MDIIQYVSVTVLETFTCAGLRPKQLMMNSTIKEASTTKCLMNVDSS